MSAKLLKFEGMEQRTGPAQAAWRTGPLLPALPQTTSLDVYDLRAVSPEDLLTVTTLIGLVNRGSAKIYGLENSDDEFWLTQIDPVLVRARPQVAGNLLDHLLNSCREQVEGLIIYDPGLPDTRNVASTLAGLRNGLAVSPGQAGGLQAAPHRLPVLVDLRAYGWRTRLQAYAWAYQQLLPECSPELVAGLHPDIRGRLRSFLVTQRVFTCWLDARKILPSPASGGLSERGLLKRVLSRFRPGSAHLGWFISEPFAIRLASRAALLTLASDHCTNLAVWSSLPEQPVEQDLRMPVEVISRLRSVDERDEAKMTYLSFTISDGDNLQYCQHRLLHLWRDQARGDLPLGWTISPALKQTMPALAEFYRRSATANDTLIAGPSGAAYMLPSHWPRAHLAAFLQLTAAYMQDMRLESLQVLDSAGWFSMKFLDPELQKFFVARLAGHGLRGIFSGAGSGFPSWRICADVPIYQNLGLALNPRCALRLIRCAAARGTRFINVYIFAWNINPGDLQLIVSALGDTFRVVTPARLLELIQQESG